MTRGKPCRRSPVNLIPASRTVFVVGLEPQYLRDPGVLKLNDSYHIL
ncbi:hypothetical protein CKA32_004017 [Geitlerinema sp. FC II]|nr:hypothetical protein CKA32_004017 [Geitlerinema sp. FC II]